MSSLVLELQRDAMDDKVPVSTLLRKSLVIAKKLDLDEFGKWVEKELNGHKPGDKPPEYRIINGEIKVFSQFAGLQGGWVSIEWPGEPPFWARTIPVAEGAGQIEELLARKRGKSGALVLTLPYAIRPMLTQVLGEYGEIRFVVSESALSGILHCLRTRVTDWSAQLRTEEPPNPRMSTSPEEQKTGDTIYHIQNFQGVLGNVSGRNIQIGDYNSIHTQLAKLGVPLKERHKLEEITEELKTAQNQPEKKAKLLKAGLEWVVRNAPQLGTLSETIRKWFSEP